MKKSSPASAKFYETLGLAIVQWSRVEDAMCDLFTRLAVCGLTGGGMGMGKEREYPTGEGIFLLGNIFYSTTNFRGRLELLGHMLSRLVRDEKLLAEWTAIKNKAGRMYARRNVLAHGSAWGRDETDPAFMSYSIFSTQDQEMDFQQMEQAKESFTKFAERISQLAIDANAHLANRKRDPTNGERKGSIS